MVLGLASSTTRPWSLPGWCGVMTGTSLVPVILTVTVFVSKPPWPSLTTTVNFCCTVSPSLSDCTFWLPVKVHLPVWSRVSVPYSLLPLPTMDQLCLSCASTSATCNWPLAELATSSLKAPVLWPLMCGASLVPRIVTVTLVGVPSAVFTVYVSTSFSPRPRAWTSALPLARTKVHRPLACSVNVPCSPVTFWGWKEFWPASASETFSLPPVICARMKSSTTVPESEPVICGTSLVPVRVTVMVCRSVPPWPSSTCTTKVSCTSLPSGRAWIALGSAVYVHLPFWSMVSVPYCPCGLPVMDQVWLSLVSTSATANWPDTAGTASSLSAALLSPLISGMSLVPSMVTVTVVGVPSAETTVNCSVRCSPTASACTAGSLFARLYVQLPLASTLKVPCLPGALSWAWKNDWSWSASVMSSLPCTLNVTSSCTVPLSPPGVPGVMTGTSSVPLIVMVMVLVVVPSWLVTVYVSTMLSPLRRPCTTALLLSTV
ncbi:hypothetical protein BOFL111202_17745 [Bordetella flabilis]